MQTQNSPLQNQTRPTTFVLTKSWLRQRFLTINVVVVRLLLKEGRDSIPSNMRSHSHHSYIVMSCYFIMNFTNVSQLLPDKQLSIQETKRMYKYVTYMNMTMKEASAARRFRGTVNSSKNLLLFLSISFSASINTCISIP